MKSFQDKFLSAILLNDFDPGLLELIEPVGSLSPEESIRVYQTDYTARMIESLGQNFETTWVLLGDDEFFSLGNKYIETHPSSFRNLTSYGHEFDEFLKDQNAETEVIQMASFEKAFWKFFHQEPSVKQTIQNIDEAVFECNFYLSHSDIKLYDLWVVRETPPESLDDFLEDEYLCIFKKEAKVEVQKLSEIQFKLLNLFKDFHILSEVVQQTEQLRIEATENDWATVLEICLWS